MERVTDKYVFFWGSEFSNWYDCFFRYRGLLFYNSEQAFMYEKAKFFHDDIIASQILACDNPSVCKSLGRKVRGFDTKKWLTAGYPFMVEINYAKYNQNLQLKELLLSTGDKTIVEASPYDNIWGIGIHWNDDNCLDESKWKGQNLLGKALMEVRKQLKE